MFEDSVLQEENHEFDSELSHETPDGGEVLGEDYVNFEVLEEDEIEEDSYDDVNLT